MSGPRKVLLLYGSAKGAKSTSGSLGDYILSRLPDDDIEKESLHIGKALRSDERWTKLVLAVDSADTIILSYPLYWDGLPSHVVQAVERLREHRKASPTSKPQLFVAMVNNGFPEPWHNEVSLRICRRFADETGFEWGGGLNVGGGAAIGGKSMEDSGGMTIKLREALDLAAEPIGSGEPIPKEIEELVANPLYPAWINTTLGGFGWRSQARKNKVKGSLKARPYEK
jgi:hypothetical protein